MTHRAARSGNATSTEGVSVQGVLPVFQLPFHEDETIDYRTLEAEIEWLIESGVSGVVFAMVSEVLRLTDAERGDVASAVCDQCRGRIASVISVGAESTFAALRHAAHAEAVGASAVMAIPPIATAAPAGETRAYFEALIRETSIPVIVQDASGYVGQSMSLTMQAELFEAHPDRVMFKPEATPIGPRLSELRDATGGKARVFEGTGGIALVDSFQRGVVGTMPGADIIDALVRLWAALSAGETEVVNALAPLVCAYISLSSTLDGFLAVEKHILQRRGVFSNTIIRGPRDYDLDEETRREVDRLFDLLQTTLQKHSQESASP
jgi:4-hydroxy-tetrahydrodipicolinate synthase